MQLSLGVSYKAYVTEKHAASSIAELQCVRIIDGVVLLHVPPISAVVTELPEANLATKWLWELVLSRHVALKAVIVPHPLATDRADAGQMVLAGCCLHGLL